MLSLLLETSLMYFMSVQYNEQNLLAEPYLHNFLLSNALRWHPNPYISDVHLRALASLIYRLIQCN